MLPDILATLFQRFWPVTLQGEEHLPRRGPAILVANHASYLDPLVLMLISPTRLRFLGWQTHYNLPILGWGYRALGVIPVDVWGEGVAIRPRAYRQALACLQSGEVLAVFPEGGRSPDGRFLKWRTGAARLALASGAPLVPITLNGLYRAWPMHRGPRPTPLSVVVHPPIAVTAWEHLPRQQAAHRLTAHLRAVVAAAYRPPAPADLPPPDWPNPYLTHPRWREALEQDPAERH